MAARIIHNFDSEDMVDSLMEIANVEAGEDHFFNEISNSLRDEFDIHRVYAILNARISADPKSTIIFQSDILYKIKDYLSFTRTSKPWNSSKSMYHLEEMIEIVEMAFSINCRSEVTRETFYKEEDIQYSQDILDNIYKMINSSDVDLIDKFLACLY